jgi:hypothetical protein
MQTPTHLSVRVPIRDALSLYTQAKQSDSSLLTHIATVVGRQIKPAGIELKLHQSQTHLQIAFRFDTLQAQKLQGLATLEGCSAYDWIESQLLLGTPSPGVAGPPPRR